MSNFEGVLRPPDVGDSLIVIYLLYERELVSLTDPSWHEVGIVIEADLNSLPSVIKNKAETYLLLYSAIILINVAHLSSI